MKNLKIPMFGILMACLYLTSCKKDADLQHQQDTPAENKEKLFEKSLPVFNADKTNSTTLRFRAASQELLDKMQLENTEFTLVETPVLTNEAARPATRSTGGDEGSANYSDKDASPLNASLPNSSNEKQVLPEDAIQIDFPLEPKTKSFSLEVKTKGLNNGTTRSATEQATTAYYYSKFYFINGWHRIKVTNLMSSSPIAVYFYNYYFGWYYSGYAFTLYNYGGGGQDWHCSRTVGATVYSYYYHHYYVNYYSSWN